MCKLWMEDRCWTGFAPRTNSRQAGWAKTEVTHCIQVRCKSPVLHVIPCAIWLEIGMAKVFVGLVVLTPYRYWIPTLLLIFRIHYNDISARCMYFSSFWLPLKGVRVSLPTCLSVVFPSLSKPLVIYCSLKCLQLSPICIYGSTH